MKKYHKETNKLYFQHQYGGLYELLGTAKHSDDGSLVYVYSHIWPFEAQVWVRPATEWQGRFKPITAEELQRHCNGDRVAAAEAVRSNKHNKTCVFSKA